MFGPCRSSLLLAVLVTSPVLAVGDVIPPSEVGNLNVNKSGNDTVLTWDPVMTDLLGNAESGVGYTVFRGTMASFIPDRLGGPNRIADPTTTDYADAGALLASESYFYLVSAVDSQGNVGNPRGSDVTSAPTLAGNFSTTAADLNWTPAGGDVAGYLVLWGTQSGNYTNTKDVGVSVVDSVFPLIVGLDHFFVVVPYDSEGNLGPASNEFSGRLADAGVGTEVCGRIDSATTWALADSPFVVTCDIEVWDGSGPFDRGPGGAVLTIEPGVIVRFEPGTEMTIGSTTADSGTLFATGTQAQPIIFTANKTFPAAGDWDGIRFNDSANDGSTLQFAAIEFAGRGTTGAGLTLDDANPLISNVVVRESANYGIDIEAAGSPNLNAVTVSGTADYGIYVGGAADPIITNSVIDDVADGFHGIYFATTTNAILQNNDIDHGLFFVSRNGNPTITGNTFRRYDDLASQVAAGELGEVLGTSTFAGSTPNSRLHYLSETIAEDTTWSNPGFPLVAVSGDTIFADRQDDPAVLTIEPGLQIRFRSGTRLEFGSGVFQGALIAVGTPSQPIVFTTDNLAPAPGQWEGISFRNASNDGISIVDNAIVEYAGASLSSNIYVEAAAPTIRNSVIRNSSVYGIYGPTTPASPLVENNQFSGNANYDVYIASTSSAVLDGNTFSSSVYFTGAGSDYQVINNTFNDFNNPNRPMRVGAHAIDQIDTNTFNGTGGSSRIEVLGERVRQSATWSDVGVPYSILGNTTFAGTPAQLATLTIEPGTTLRMAASVGLFIGTSADRGAAIVVGTQAQPITFTTDNSSPAPGQWRSLYFDSQADSSSLVEYTLFEYGGVSDSSLLRMVGSAPTIRNNTFRNSSVYGVYGTSGASPLIEDNVFANNVNFDLLISGASDAQVQQNSFGNAVQFQTAGGTHAVINNQFNNYNDPTLHVRVGAHAVEGLQTNTFLGTGPNSLVEILGETLDVDYRWYDLGFPYAVLGDVVVAKNALEFSTLTIDPGTQLRFNSSIGLFVGTSANQGMLSAVGTVADPILFTTNNPAPAPGQWQGVYFDSLANDASVLEHAIVEYAGQTYSSNVRVVLSSPTIRNNTIRSSSVYGIYGTSGPSPLIENNDFSTNVNFDVRIDGVSDALVHQNSFTSAVQFTTGGGTHSVINNQFNDYDDATRSLRVGAHAVEGLQTNTFLNTGVSSLAEVLGETLSEDARWFDLGFPYALIGDVVIARNPLEASTLTIDPGSELRFNSGVGLFVGTSANQGALIASGGPSNPIVFTTNNPAPAPGQWQGVYFDSLAVDATSILENCVVEYAGQTYSANVRVVTSSPTLRNCTFNNSSVYGVYVSNAPTAPIVQNNTMNNVNYDVYVSGVSDATITENDLTTGAYFTDATNDYTFRDNTISNYDGSFNLRIGAHELGSLTTNTFNNVGPTSEIQVLGETVDQDGSWPNLGMPYRVVGNVTIAGTPEVATAVTIAAGTEWRFDSGVGLFVGTATNRGRLTAIGTDAEPIVFTTSNAVPAPGQWRSVYFNAGAEDSSILQDCVVEYGGQSDSANVRVVSSSPTVRECEIRNSSVYGLYGTVASGQETSSPTIADNIFSGQANFDVLISTGSDAIVSGNSFDQSVRFDSAIGQPTVQNNTFNNYIAPNLLRIPADSVNDLTGNVFNDTDATSTIEVLGEILSADAQWQNPGLAYDIIGDLSVYGDTVTPGGPDARSRCDLALPDLPCAVCGDDDEPRCLGRRGDAGGAGHLHRGLRHAGRRCLAGDLLRRRIGRRYQPPGELRRRVRRPDLLQQYPFGRSVADDQQLRDSRQ